MRSGRPVKAMEQGGFNETSGLKSKHETVWLLGFVCLSPVSSVIRPPQRRGLSLSGFTNTAGA